MLQYGLKLKFMVKELQYIAYLATSGSKRETIKKRTCALCLPTN